MAKKKWGMRIMYLKCTKLFLVAFAIVMLAGCGKSSSSDGDGEKKDASPKLSSMEIRELKYKLEQQREALMRLDRGQGSGTHIDDFVKYFKIGSEALAQNDLAAAREGFQLADREAKWLVANEARCQEEARRMEARRQILATGDRVLELTGNVKLALVKIEAGPFTMGARDGENFDNEKEHQVTLTRDFYIGKTEVTQAQWKAVMGTDPSYFKGDDLPVDSVSWIDAMEFCKKLNDSGKAPDGWKFTLPTEAQWEYAARGGNRSRGYKYSGSNDASEVAWYDNNSGRQPHPVALKKANAFGLYDMSGNVWEWCLDLHEDGYVGDPEFLKGNSGRNRVLRGGSWFDDAWNCRSARRIVHNPGHSGDFFGFRVVLVQCK